MNVSYHKETTLLLWLMKLRGGERDIPLLTLYCALIHTITDVKLSTVSGGITHESLEFSRYICIPRKYK